MSRYIDADKLKERMGEEPKVWNDTDAEIQARNDYRDFMTAIDAAPTEDVEAVVRCKADYFEKICGGGR